MQLVRAAGSFHSDLGIAAGKTSINVMMIWFNFYWDVYKGHVDHDLKPIKISSLKWLEGGFVVKSYLYLLFLFKEKRTDGLAFFSSYSRIIQWREKESKWEKATLVIYKKISSFWKV